MTPSTIDEATLQELRLTLGDDFLPELISTYLDETPRLLKDLQQALAEGKADAFGRTAHSIKSSSASLGALAFSAQARELEMIGKSGDLSQAADKITNLIRDYPEVELALKNYV
jgi:HPt (histidine-containing phosphotransfer) domain-containing protein